VGPKQVVVVEPARAAGVAAIEPGRDVPVDPAKGSDFTLSTSYALLLKSIGEKR